MILLAVSLFGLTIFADISWLAVIDSTGRITLRFYEKLRTQVVKVRNERAEVRQATVAQQKRKEIVATKAKAVEKRIPPSIQMPKPKPEAAPQYPQLT